MRADYLTNLAQFNDPASQRSNLSIQVEPISSNYESTLDLSSIHVNEEGMSAWTQAQFDDKNDDISLNTQDIVSMNTHPIL